MAWFASGDMSVIGKADAVEMAGVIELDHAPAVWGVEVFVQYCNAGVVEYKAPLIGDSQVQ